MKSTQMRQALDQITLEYKSRLETEYIVDDGVADCELYYKTIPKILWVLKEPRGEGEDSWSVTADVFGNSNKALEAIKGSSGQTVRRIATTSFALVHNLTFMEAKERRNEELVEVLKRIGFINVSKRPEGKASVDAVAKARIQDDYNKTKGLIHKQIEVLDPLIIIFGGSINFFDEYFDTAAIESEGNYYKFNETGYFKSNCRIIISSYHPSYLKYSEDMYINDILEICRNNSWPL